MCGGSTTTNGEVSLLFQLTVVFQRSFSSVPSPCMLSGFLTKNFNSPKGKYCVCSAVEDKPVKT